MQLGNERGAKTDSSANEREYGLKIFYRHCKFGNSNLQNSSDSVILAEKHDDCLECLTVPNLGDNATHGGAYLAKPDSAKSESAVQERAKPYFAKPGN